MKKFLLILILSFFTGLNLFAQVDGEQGGKIQERMNEYLQKRLGLSKNEIDKFSPVFSRYLKELRKAYLDNADILKRQQRMAEIRLQFREEFKPIVGETRANKVFIAEQEFRKKAAEILRERNLEKRTNKKFRSLIQ